MEKAKAIDAKRLALANIRRKPYRTAAMLALIALSAGVLFGSLIFASSLKGGIKGLQSRIGADLMIVPEGYESKVEGVLLSGEPCYFYMDRNVADAVGKVEGVECLTSQFYLTSLSESCCDFPIQIIGFDSGTDFIVKNWARSRYKGSGKKDSSGSHEVIFAGSNVNITNNTVKFFGETHKVLSRLAKSGTGMDNVIYADLPTLQGIFEAAKKKGFGFISDGDTRNKTSVLFVKIADGYKADGVALRIKNVVPDVQVIRGESFVSGLAEKLSSFMFFLYANCILVFLIAVLTLAVVFSMSLNERLKEFSILRVLGTDHAGLRAIVFAEAAVLGSIGAVAGIAAAAGFVLPFNIAISEKIGLPFAMSSVEQIALFAVVVFVISLASCLVASLFSAVRISKFEPYGEVK
ncbi:MAG: ABC transporter permease [Treponema sp.]|nr:ABC transporter permease [Treponema sp.]